MSESPRETSLTAAEAQEQDATPPPAEPDLDADLERETVEQELRAIPTSRPRADRLRPRSPGTGS